jgi:hypothetical protein
MHSDYVYKDRKMMKWMPFNALLEQGDYVSDLLLGKSRKQMPSLSSDQYDELNYQLEEAYALHLEITVTYYENFNHLETTGYITRTDNFNKLIFINDTPISAQTIISIK